MVLSSSESYSSRNNEVINNNFDRDIKVTRLRHRGQIQIYQSSFRGSYSSIIRDSMRNGPLAGFEVDSMKVTLKDGSFHPVDSDSLSFELAAKLGFKESSRSARAVIMEPIMKLEVLTPEENMGDIVGDLNRRRGQVNSMDDRAGSKVVKAEVPLSEMFGYVTSLRTLSSGRATSTMEFSHYAETPNSVSETVISEIKGQSE